MFFLSRCSVDASSAVVTVLSLGLILSTVACRTLPGSASIDLAGAEHAYAQSGSTGPIVVFESGLGDGKESWTAVFAATGEFAHAFAYDRAGYGGSASSAAARDGETIVEELRALLASLELPPPYLLVGHSIGGHFVELYARMYPSEVAGVVFVDARHAEFSARCIREKAERCDVPLLAKLLMPSAAKAELAASPTTEESLRDAPEFPAIPVRVLTAARRPQNMPNLRRAWAEAQADLAQLSPLATQTICDECGHYVHRDRPDIVVNAIRSIADELERRRSGNE